MINCRNKIIPSVIHRHQKPLEPTVIIYTKIHIDTEQFKCDIHIEEIQKQTRLHRLLVTFKAKLNGEI
jgi:hypothetical protein